MGHDLTRMLLAGMPADWTASERLIALVLADHCSDKTHAGYVSNAQLCDETGYGPDAIRRALGSLARRGYDFRVSVKVGSDGRQVYTNRGRATDYRVPILPPRPKGVRDIPPSQPKRRARSPLKVCEIAAKGGTSRTPLPPVTPPTPIQPPSLVTPTGGSPPAGPGPGYAGSLIERQAWEAIQRRDQCSETTIPIPRINTTITPARSSGSAPTSQPAA